MAQATKSPWKRLGELLALDKATVSQLYIYAILSGMLGLSLPLGIQSVIHFIQGGQITTSWVVLVCLVILGVVLTGTLQMMQMRLTENIQQRIFVRYSFDFAYRFPRLNRLAVSGKIPSELMNRFFDIISLQKGIGKVLLDFSAASLQIVFSLLVLSFYHPFYIGFSIALVVLLYLIFRPFIRHGFTTSLEESSHKYKTAHWLQEIARADWSFRLTPNGQHYLRQLDEPTTNYLHSRERHFGILWKQYIWLIAIKSVIVASLLGLGGFLVIDQQMNLGQFVAAEVLILLLLGAVEKMIQTLENLYDVMTSLEKLGVVQDLPMTFEEPAPSNNKQIFPIEIIETAGEKASVLVSIEEKQHTFLHCTNQRNGATILRQFIDPTVSETRKPRWNFHIPKNGELAANLERIGWFAKGVHLFEGTLRNNVLMGRPELTSNDLREALEIVGMDYFPTRMSDGYDTFLTKANKLLSEEERERILIARAIVHKPEVLFISTHGLALSHKSLNEIIEQIMKHLPETTVVVTGPTPFSGTWNELSLNAMNF